MAAGDLKGFLSGKTASTPSGVFAATGSVAVNVGDLVYGVAIEQNQITSDASFTDNLGNTYNEVRAGTDTGSNTGHAYWARVNTPGTLTSVNFASFASSANDLIVLAVVIEGPFKAAPTDANPAQSTNNSSTTLNCPASGALASDDEVVLSWIASLHTTGASNWAADSPFATGAADNQPNVIAGAIGYQKVSAASSVTPSFTRTGAAPSQAVQGTTSFRLLGTPVFGEVLAQLEANTTDIPNTFSATTATIGGRVSVGDLIVCAVSESIADTFIACTDNLGNTYAAANPGLVGGTDVGARMFYSRVTCPGVLTSVNADTTASSHNASIVAVAYAGPFDTAALDQAATMIAQSASPLQISWGTLAQADELIVSHWAKDTSSAAAATAPMVIDGAALATGGPYTQIASQTVASTAGGTAEWTFSVSSQAVAGLATFKKGDDADIPAVKPVSTLAGGAADGGNATAAVSGIAGIEPGDLVVIYAFTGNVGSNPARIGNAAGYTEFINQNSAAATFKGRAAWKIYDGGADPVIEGTGDTAYALRYCVEVFRGADDTNPIDVSASDASADAPSVTPATADCTIFAATGSANSDTTPGTMANYIVPTMGGGVTSDTNIAGIHCALRFLSGGAGVAEDPPAWSSLSTTQPISITVAIKPASTGVTGDLAATEGADTLSAAGALALQGSLAVTEGADVLASSAFLTRIASLAATEGADTLSSAAKLAIAGNLAKTEGADVLTSSAFLTRVASLAVTEGADALAAAATLGRIGSLAATEGADTLSAAGKLAIAGTAAITEGADTLAAAAALAIAGSLAVTEGADTLAATGTGPGGAIFGTLAVTEGADTLSAAAFLTRIASLAVTEGADTLNSAAALAIAGNAAIAEGADTLSSAAALAIAGSLAVTEGADVVASSAFLTRIADLAATEGADALSSIAVLAIAASAAITEGADTLAAAGTLARLGNLIATEGADTLSAHGAFSASVGNLAKTEGPDILIASASVSGARKLAIALFM